MNLPLNFHLASAVMAGPFFKLAELLKQALQAIAQGVWFGRLLEQLDWLNRRRWFNPWLKPRLLAFAVDLGKPAQIGATQRGMFSPYFHIAFRKEPRPCHGQASCSQSRTTQQPLSNWQMIRSSELLLELS